LRFRNIGQIFLKNVFQFRNVVNVRNYMQVGFEFFQIYGLSFAVEKMPIPGNSSTFIVPIAESGHHWDTGYNGTAPQISCICKYISCPFVLFPRCPNETHLLLHITYERCGSEYDRISSYIIEIRRKRVVLEEGQNTQKEMGM